MDKLTISIFGNQIFSEILNELKLKGKKIGIEYDAYGLTGKNALELNNSLKNFLKLFYHSYMVPA